MATYSADQIVGKTLIAHRSVDLKRQPSADTKTIYIVPPGQSVGTVYSWVNGGGGIWWQFLDKNQNPYYAKHGEGFFDVANLSDQGAVSVEEQHEQQQQQDNPVGYYIKKFATPIVLLASVYFGVKIFNQLQSREK